MGEQIQINCGKKEEMSNRKKEKHNKEKWHRE